MHDQAKRRFLLGGFGPGFLLGIGVGVALFTLLSLLFDFRSRPRPGNLRGLWEVVSVRNLDTGEYQPHRREFHLFGRTHQMVILAGEGRPKLSKSFSDMNAEEIMSQQPIGAGLYRYEIAGAKIERTNVAALSAHYENRVFIGDLEVAGDTLVFRDRHSADGAEREWTMRRVR